MAGPKGVFKSAGKKLKKVFSKKRRARRAPRHAGLPGGPQVPGPQVQNPQPQGPQGWVGGERHGERGGRQIGQNRGPRGWVGGERQGERGGLQIGQRPPTNQNTPETNAPETQVETQNTSELNPSSNPYVSTSTGSSEGNGHSPYDIRPFNPLDEGSENGSGSGATYSTPASDEAPQPTNEKTTAPETNDSQVVKEPETEKGQQKVKGPYQRMSLEAVSSGSLSSSSTSVSDDEEEANQGKVITPALKLERDRVVGNRVRVAQKVLKKEAESKKPPTKVSMVNPYAVDKSNIDSQFSDSNQQFSDSLISSTDSEINTSKYELPPDDMLMIVAEVERELGIAALDVQDKFEGDTLPESVQLMMRTMREHSKGNVDAPEVCRGQSIAVKRGEKTHNEKLSKGWATIAMRSTYVNTDANQGKDGSFNTKYFFDEATNLEQIAVKVLGSQQEKGREKLVIRYKDNQWLDADDKAVDTSGAGEMEYSITLRQEKLKAKIAEAKQRKVGQEDEKTLEALGERISKLKEKLQIDNVVKHKSVSGKFIYVMNAAGDFFAAKHVQFVVHHSSFLAGGAIATAGEVGISGGKLDYISNQSGHYRPGPAYLWQAVKQLELLGCPLEGVQVQVMTAKGKFKNAKDFLGSMDPTSDPKLFDSTYAIAHLNGILDGMKSKKDVA